MTPKLRMRIRMIMRRLFRKGSFKKKHVLVMDSLLEGALASTFMQPLLSLITKSKQNEFL